jgi:hypothetical protein
MRAARVAVVLFALVVARPFDARADDTVAAACIAQSERGQLARDEARFLEARGLFVACARDECPRFVRHDCVEFLGDLQKRIPTVVLVARDAAGNDLTRVRVSMDGAPLAETLGATAIAVDPGQHVFRFERSGGPPAQATVLVREGERDRPISVVLGDAPRAKPQAAKPAEPVPVGVPTATWVLGGLALAGAATFATLSIVALGDAKHLEHTCSPRCSDDQIAPVSREFLIARVAGVIGAVAAVGAGVVYLLARGSSRERHARVAPFQVTF